MEEGAGAGPTVQGAEQDIDGQIRRLGWVLLLLWIMVVCWITKEYWCPWMVHRPPPRERPSPRDAAQLAHLAHIS